MALKTHSKYFLIVFAALVTVWFASKSRNKLTKNFAHEWLSDEKLHAKQSEIPLLAKAEEKKEKASVQQSAVEEASTSTTTNLAEQTATRSLFSVKNFDDVAHVSSGEVPSCGLVAPVFQDEKMYKNQVFKEAIEFEEIRTKFNLTKRVTFGGIYEGPPATTCRVELKIAIIIPYRDRLSNFKVFVANMFPFLMRQRNLTVGIYLVEPAKDLRFNRGLLMNAGFVEALKDRSDWNCFFFHDVDMIPEDFRNLYKCDSDKPVHYAVAVSKYKYSTTGYFSYYYGGINAFSLDQYKKINGFSNMFYGWGGEDDDLLARTKAIYGEPRRRNKVSNRYWTADHVSQKINKDRGHYLNSNIKKYKQGNIDEGLSNLNYTLTRLVKNPLYTHFFISHDPGPDDIKAKKAKINR